MKSHVLLLDCENIPHFEQVENRLFQMLGIHFDHKIAVANFALPNANKLSSQLEAHRYIMLNVPSYSNSADKTIINTAMYLAIFTRHFQHFFLVSNDKIFLQLQSALLLLGKQAHVIGFSNNTLFLNDIQNNGSKATQYISVEEQLAQLILNHSPLSFSQLATLYKQTHHKSLKTALGSHPLKKLKNNRLFNVNQNHIITLAT